MCVRARVYFRTWGIIYGAAMYLTSSGSRMVMVDLSSYPWDLNHPRLVGFFSVLDRGACMHVEAGVHPNARVDNKRPAW